MFDLLTLIECARCESTNPPLSEELAVDYLQASHDLHRLIYEMSDEPWEELFAQKIAGWLLVVKGSRRLALAVSQLFEYALDDLEVEGYF